MVLPPPIDIAIAVERLVPQASFDTAYKTDIDADDYAALVRTWHDMRPLPTFEALTGAWLAYQAEHTQSEENKALRRLVFLNALSNDPGDIELGEIQAISSLADAKIVLLKMVRALRIMRALVAMLRNRDDVAQDS